MTRVWQCDDSIKNVSWESRILITKATVLDLSMHMTFGSPRDFCTRVDQSRTGGLFRNGLNKGHVLALPAKDVRPVCPMATRY